VRPDRRGVLLALSLLEHALERPPSVLEDLVRLSRGDAGARLIACNAWLEGGAPDAASARRIVRVSEAQRGTHAAGAVIQLLRARALRRLGRAGAARDVCARAAAQPHGRQGALGAALRLEQAAALTDLGRHAEALRKRGEVEAVFALRAERDGIALDVGG
jgi:hypothetical protein